MFAYIPAKDVNRARKFYEEKLGFTPQREESGGVVGILVGRRHCDGWQREAAWFKDTEGNILAIIQNTRSL